MTSVSAGPRSAIAGLPSRSGSSSSRRFMRRKRNYVQSVGGILEAVAIHEFLGGDRCARPLRESGDAFELDLAVKLLERSAVFFALLHRCLGHLVGKGGPPRNEEKNQVDDFHRLVIPIAGIAMPGTSGLTAPALQSSSAGSRRQSPQHQKQHPLHRKTQKTPGGGADTSEFSW